MSLTKKEAAKSITTSGELTLSRLSLSVLSYLSISVSFSQSHTGNIFIMILDINYLRYTPVLK